MTQGKSLATLLSTLDHNQGKFRSFVDALSRSAGHPLTLETIRGFVVEGREYLTCEALIELGVILPSEHDQSLIGHVTTQKLDWLVLDAELILDALAYYGTLDIVSKPEIELAWTLPAQLASFVKEGSSARSLAGLFRYAISRASSRLILVSPFLEQRGLEFLEAGLTGAVGRGVEVILISHELSTPDSYGYRAYNYLKQVVPSIKGYSVQSETASPYVLIHSKVVVADSSYVVLSSANLTHAGLATHLELGIGVSGTMATEVERLFLQVIESNLVERVP